MWFKTLVLLTSLSSINCKIKTNLFRKVNQTGHPSGEVSAIKCATRCDPDSGCRFFSYNGTCAESAASSGDLNLEGETGHEVWKAECPFRLFTTGYVGKCESDHGGGSMSLNVLANPTAYSLEECMQKACVCEGCVGGHFRANVMNFSPGLNRCTLRHCTGGLMLNLNGPYQSYVLPDYDTNPVVYL